MPILSRTTTALVARLAGAAVTFHAAALQALLRKANFDPNQPRVPERLVPVDRSRHPLSKRDPRTKSGGR